METIVGLVVAFVLGTLLSVAGAVLVVRLQRERRRLGYSLGQSGVVVRRPDDAAGNVVVSVPEELLETGLEDIDTVPNDPTFVPVENVTGYSVELRNTGNTILDSLDIRLQLDSRAKIVSAWVDDAPDFGDEAIVLTRDRTRPNVLHVSPPYLNRGFHFIVRLLAVENLTFDCSVAAAGPGLELQPIGSGKPGLPLVLAISGIAILLVGISGLLTGVAMYGLDSDPGNEAIFRDSAGGKFIIVSSITGPIVGVTLVTLAGVERLRQKLNKMVRRYVER